MLKRTAFIIAVFSFIVYFLTLPPTVTSYGDSSEMIVSAYNLTAAHPPGYPLYTLIGKLFTLLPINSVAWRVHLSSAVFGSLTVGFVYRTLVLLTKNQLSSLLATLILAFAHSFWLYNITAEVFALNNLLAILTIYSTLKWQEAVTRYRPRAAKYLYLASLFLGLGLSNHFSIILVVPGIIYLIFITQPKILLKKIIKLVIFFSLGLLPYWQLIYSAHRPHPPAYGNFPGLKRFIAYVLRLDYGGPISAGAIISPPQTAPDTFFYFKLLAQQFTPLAFLVILFGFWALYKKSRWDKLAILIFYFFTGPLVFWRYLRQVDPNDLHVLGVAERFSLLSFVPFTLCLGLGLATLLPKIDKKKALARQNLMLLLVIGLTGWQLTRTWPLVNKRNYYLAHNYGLNILNQIEENAIVFSTDDLTNSTLDYFIQVEAIKPNVTVISSAFLSNREYQREIKQNIPELYQKSSTYEYDIIRDIIKTQAGKRPLYFIMLDDPHPLGFENNPYRFVPKGLVLAAPTNLVMSEVQNELKTTDYWQTYHLEGIEKNWPEAFAKLTAHTYAFRHRINATVYLEQLEIYSMARSEAEAALKLDPQDEQAKKILQRLGSEFKDFADDFRPKTDIDYGRPVEEHLEKAKVLAQTPSKIQNFNLHRAMYELRRAKDKDAQNAEIYGWLGIIYEYFNCWLEAAVHYRQAVRLDPENQQWRDHLQILIDAGVLPEKPPEGII